MSDEPEVVQRAREALKEHDRARREGLRPWHALGIVSASLAELILSHERYRHDAESLVETVEAHAENPNAGRYMPYETAEGVVTAVDLDGTVHRSKPAPTEAQVEAGAQAFSLVIHQIDLVWKHMKEADRDLYREATRAALEAARDA